MKTGPYYLTIDGFCDKNETEKFNPLTVRFFSDVHGEVHTQFLDMCSTSGKEAATAASIFAVVNEKMGVCNVPWSNCVAFSVDNASVNIG
jgi:hypothetical protein